jgi:hypothetical protein
MEYTLKYNKHYKDDITRAVITSLCGHELYGDSPIVARIFTEYKQGRKLHFPQIDDNKNENIYFPENGFAKMKDAKKWLETTLFEIK